jgi:fluoride ion exporter CrcB/FEX
MRDILIIGAGGFIGVVLRYFAVLSMQVFKTKHNGKGIATRRQTTPGVVKLRDLF